MIAEWAIVLGRPVFQQAGIDALIRHDMEAAADVDLDRDLLAVDAGESECCDFCEHTAKLGEVV